MKKLNAENRATRSPITPLANFQKLEADRQREWLFRRHRKTRPVWKRD